MKGDGRGKLKKSEKGKNSLRKREKRRESGTGEREVEKERFLMERVVNLSRAEYS